MISTITVVTPETILTYPRRTISLVELLGLVNNTQKKKSVGRGVTLHSGCGYFEYYVQLIHVELCELYGNVSQRLHMCKQSYLLCTIHRPIIIYFELLPWRFLILMSHMQGRGGRYIRIIYMYYKLQFMQCTIRHTVCE